MGFSNGMSLASVHRMSLRPWTALYRYLFREKRCVSSLVSPCPDLRRVTTAIELDGASVCVEKSHVRAHLESRLSQESAIVTLSQATDEHYSVADLDNSSDLRENRLRPLSTARLVT